VHAQRVPGRVVEELLGRIPDLAILPLEGADRCCGAAGVYHLLHPAMAEAILEEKVEAIRRTGAEILVTGNPGCALQIAAGLRGSGIEVLHPVELLARALPEEAPTGSPARRGPRPGL
jgi:glycolate oxidase iron-sulfur subunit